jgi:N-acetylmuramoyl-L-alanine amidase
MNITKTIIHHTGSVQGNPYASTRHHTAEIINAHHKTLWPDFISSLGWYVGYTYVIEASGKTVQTRATNETGAHTIGMNNSSIGICLTGNFDVELPTKEQEDALVKLFYKLKEEFSHLTPYDVVPHRHYSTKSCFGNKLPDDYFQKIITASLKPKEKVEEKVQYDERARMLKLIELLKKLIALLSSQIGGRNYE